MSTWRSLLLRIGDKCTEYGSAVEFKDHIEICYGVLRREIEYDASSILVHLLQCAEQLPHKIPLYGTLAGLINLEDEDFVKELLEKCHSNLQDSITVGNSDKMRVILRFLTSLMCSKVLQPMSLVILFDTLLSSAASMLDEEKGNPYWQARGDFYVRCILSCLPWGGAELAEQAHEEIERVMVGLEAYFSIRKVNSGYGLSFLDEDESKNFLGKKDFLDDLWKRIQDLSAKGWIVDSVPRPHLAFEAQLISGKVHEFHPINIPQHSDLTLPQMGTVCGIENYVADSIYSQRLRRLNIFPVSKFEDMQPVDRFVVEEYILDVLLFLNGCRKECAASLANLPVPFRYEFLMAETIFSQLLLLPQPPFKPIYYTLVIMDLCKALPGAFPAIVAGAVRTLFEKIADLDMECRIRLINWFSHHLSNFQFIWPWEEWAYVLDLPKWAPQRVFVQEVFEREVRLSFWDIVKQRLENSPGLEELLPPKAVPNFKYGPEDSNGDNELQTLSSELCKKVKAKETAREIISWMEESVIPAHTWTITLEVVMQTLLDIGSKSFTHLITVLERYSQVISHLCPDHDKQVMLINEIASYWVKNTQMAAIAIDRMMGYRLISNLAIVSWVFSAPNINIFHVTDRPWEVLQNAISKTFNRISDLRNEISSLKGRLPSLEEAAAEAKSELSEAESKLSLIDGEPVLGENPAKMKRLKSRAEQLNNEMSSHIESLDSKEALLFSAMEENEALYVSLFKNWSRVVAERLAGSSMKTLNDLKSARRDVAMADDDSSKMEVDEESENHRPSNGNGIVYNVGEEEQWCLTTLGYVKAISRQFASEMWRCIERLDRDVFCDAHPIFLHFVNLGLHRSLPA